MHKDNKRFRVAAGALATALLISGCGGINPSATLVNINDGEDTISLGYGNFFARYSQAGYDEYYLSQYDSSYWRLTPDGESKTMEESVKEDIMEELETMYLSAKHAEEYDVEISEEQEKKIKEVAKQFLEDNSDEAIEAMGATEEYLIQLMKEQVYSTELEKAMEKKKEEELTDDEVNQSSISMVHFVVGGAADENGEVKEFTDDELKELAESASKADDLDANVAETGFDLDPDYYTASKKAKGVAKELDVPEDVAKAIMKLKEGEVSGVLKGEEGYYVARKNKDFDEDYTEVKRTDLAEEFYDDTFEEWKDDTDWKVDERQWAKVKFDAVFEAPEDEEDEEGEAAGEAVESESQEITIEGADEESADEATDESAGDGEEASEEAADGDAESDAAGESSDEGETSDNSDDSDNSGEDESDDVNAGESSDNSGDSENADDTNEE